MKEFYTHINKKIYYTLVFIIAVLIMIGLLLDNPGVKELGVGYILHSVLAIVLIAGLLLYPKYEYHIFRIVIITAASAFLYTVSKLQKPRKVHIEFAYSLDFY